MSHLSACGLGALFVHCVPSNLELRSEGSVHPPAENFLRILPGGLISLCSDQMHLSRSDERGGTNKRVKCSCNRGWNCCLLGALHPRQWPLSSSAAPRPGRTVSPIPHTEGQVIGGEGGQGRHPGRGVG